MVRPNNRLSVAHDILRLPRIARPLRAVGFAVLVLLALPYAITPFYAVGEPVSTVMLWRRMAGERVERQYVPLSRISPPSDQGQKLASAYQVALDSGKLL